MIKNPCKQICKYDIHKVCIGCQRTMEETREWINYSEKERAEVLSKVLERENSVGIPTDHIDYYI